MRPFRLAAALLAFALLPQAGLAQESPVPERRLVYANDVDYYGADLTALFDTTLEACQAVCLTDAQCTAFTFNSRSNSCFPKSGVSETQAYDGAVSARVLVNDAAIVAAAPARAAELDFLRAEDRRAAREQARDLAADHVTDEWTYDDYARAIDEARQGGRVMDARWFAAAMAVLSDRSDAWTEYARLSLALRSDNYGTQRSYREAALAAAINGYLRGPDPAARANAAVQIARALEALERGRDMIPALRRAVAEQPRDEIRAALDDALGKYGFRIVEHQVDSDAAAPRLCAVFSDDLAAAGVDYDSFIQAETPGLTAEADGRQLCLTGIEHGQRYSVTFRAGLPAASGEATVKPVTITQYVRDRAPQVSFPGRAYILPAGGEVALPVSSVNVSEVELTLSRVSDRALVRALQDDFFGARMGAWRADQFDAEMAEEVWRGTGRLENTLNRDMTTRLPLGEAMEGLAPGIYVLRAAIPGVNRYDESTATQWFVTSDLGLATMSGADGLHAFVRSLASADPLEGVQVTLVSQGNAVLGEAVTDAQGYAHFPAGLTRGEGGAAPALVTLRMGEDFSFLPLTDPEFDLSDRGVEGREPAGPVDVFLATDRGAYRAGDTVHVTALARDPLVQAIPTLPLTVVLTRPDGVEYSRQISTRGIEGGFVFALPIDASAPRGTWRLAALVDPQAPPLAAQSLLVEDFLPERLDFEIAAPEGPLNLNAPVPLTVETRYLFGAPGADLAVDGSVTLRAAEALPDWPGYRFGRADERFETQYGQIGDGARTDEAGRAEFSVDLPAPDAGTARPMEATFRLQVAEGSGRPVERRETRIVLPGAPVIGIRPASEGPLDEGAEAAFSVIGLGADGTPRAMDLAWELNRVETRYQWYRLDGDWNWEPVTTRERIASGAAAYDGQTPARIVAPVEWGHYELRVSGEGGAAASFGFDAGWYAAEGATDTPDMLEVSLDRGAYAAGDTARLLIDARAAGKATVTVISNRLIDMKAVELAEGENVVTLPVTGEWGAGAYVTATALRPLDAGQSRNPSRALGLAYAAVDPGPRQLSAAFDVPAEAMPRAPLDVALQVDGIAPGETAHVTIAAVDLGILNLTGFKAPDPSGYYFGQRRLGMGLRDVYGRLIDGMNGAMGQVRSGGDGADGMRLQSPPPTEDLVTFFSGPLDVGADGRVTTTLDIPAFNGTLRLMAIAWSPTGVGEAQADVLIRDPVVLSATLPRFLAPGDEARLLLEITHATGPAGRVGLDLAATAGVSLGTGALPSGFEIAAGATERFAVPIIAGDAGDETVTVHLTTPGGERLEKTLRLPIRRNDPETARVSRLVLEPGATFTLSQDALAGFLPGTGSATLSLGPLARFDAPGLLAALDRYPYGCTEQVASQAMPLLYLDEVAQAMGLAARDSLAERIGQAVTQVLANQDSNGAFGLWQPDVGDLWLDAYVSDFLSRARAAGHAVPDLAFRNAIDNLRNQVNYAADFDSGGEGLAYALYVLAREGAAAMGDLRYYADVKREAFTTPLGAAQIGAALAAYGDPARADAMFTRAATLLAAASAASEPDKPVWRDDYGTPLRDAAAVLTLAAEAGSNAVDREALASRVAPQAGARALSTQEQVWSLLAAHAMLGSGEAARGIEVEGVPAEGPLVHMLESGIATPLRFSNTSGDPVPMVLTTFGVPEVPEPAGGNGYTIERRYFTTEGQPADPAEVAAGTRLVALLTVQPWAESEARLMVSDPLPAGFEIDNPSLLGSGDISALDWLQMTGNVRSAEFRSDRFLAAIDQRGDEPLRLAYIVRAITPGVFHHPAASVEDMYRPRFRAQSAPGQVRITP